MLKSKMTMAPWLMNLGVIYYEQCTRDKTKFKRMSEWWLVDVNDVVCQLPAPKEEKISTNRMLYTFQLPQLLCTLCVCENKSRSCVVFCFAFGLYRTLQNVTRRSSDMLCTAVILMDIMKADMTCFLNSMVLLSGLCVLLHSILFKLRG